MRRLALSALTGALLVAGCPGFPGFPTIPGFHGDPKPEILFIPKPENYTLRFAVDWASPKLPSGTDRLHFLLVAENGMELREWELKKPEMSVELSAIPERDNVTLHYAAYQGAIEIAYGEQTGLSTRAGKQLALQFNWGPISGTTPVPSPAVSVTRVYPPANTLATALATGSGELFVAHKNAVYAFANGTGYGGLPAPLITEAAFPAAAKSTYIDAMAYHESSGTLYACDTANMRILKIDLAASANTSVWKQFAAVPKGVAVAPNGDLFITLTKEVVWFSPTVTEIRRFSLIDSVHHIALGPSSMLYVSGSYLDTANNRIDANVWRIRLDMANPANSQVESSPYYHHSGAGEAFPGLAIAEDGTLFVSAGDQVVVRPPSMPPGAFSLKTDDDTGLAKPADLIMGSDGALYAVDSTHNTVKQVLKQP